MTRFRSDLVRRETLARIGESLDVAAQLRLGSGAKITQAMLANAVEALFGAIFIDGGYDAARAAVARAYAARLDELDPQVESKDPKSRLNELLQARGQEVPEYRLISRSGPDNDLRFEVACTLAALQLESRGTGTSLQKAQQDAARAMLDNLGS